MRGISLANKKAKKAVHNAKAKVYKEVYEKLDSKEVERIYRITRIRKRETKDLCVVRCVKDKDQKVLVRNEEIKERWKEYFDRSFNGTSTQDLVTLSFSIRI